MRAHHRYLHAFSGFEGVFGHLVYSHNWPPLGLESCFLRFRFSSPPVWKCFQPSVRELFVPILWLPRRCVFDGFLQEFEGFKGYVRPLSGRLSLAGWAGILLGLCRFGCVPTSGTSMLLAVSKACLGTSSAATLATPWAGTLLGLCRFACVPTTCTSMLLAVSKVLFGHLSAGWNPWGFAVSHACPPPVPPCF